MVRIVDSDVASSNDCSSEQLTTAVGSEASALSCGSTSPVRGVAISICISRAVSTSMGAIDMARGVVGTTWSAAR